MNTRHLVLLLLFVATPFQGIAKDKPIDGSIIFRGKIEDNHFHGSGLNIEVGGLEVLIKIDENKSEFKIPIRDQKLSDAVVSHNNKAVAVLLAGTPWPSRSRTLATSNSSGNQRVFNFSLFRTKCG